METKNTFTCDLETGVCGPADDGGLELIDLNQPKKTIDLYYVTDPICSHCWAIEPTLQKFTKQYGQYFTMHAVMGGLLEKWHDGPIDPANGIYKPADVAPHWREVGEHYRMPIDGSLMIDNPVQSSYPPSRVFKVIQKHHGDSKALEYLRRAREALFVFNENIGEQDILIKIADELGLDGETVVAEANSESGETLLQEDFALTRSLGARGFPTIIMVNEDNQGVKIVGSRPIEQFAAGLEQVLGEKPKSKQSPLLSEWLAEEKLLFSKEIEVMYNIGRSEVNPFIEKELNDDTYEIKEILGETYLVKK